MAPSNPSSPPNKNEHRATMQLEANKSLQFHFARNCLGETEAVNKRYSKIKGQLNGKEGALIEQTILSKMQSHALLTHYEKAIRR